MLFKLQKQDLRSKWTKLLTFFSNSQLTQKTPNHYAMK